MKLLDIRFVQERDSRKAQQQVALITRLHERLSKRLAGEYPDVQVRIRFSSAAGAEVSGFKDKDERKRFMAFLEELWMDDSLVEE